MVGWPEHDVTTKLCFNIDCSHVYTTSVVIKDNTTSTYLSKIMKYNTTSIKAIYTSVVVILKKYSWLSKH